MELLEVVVSGIALDKEREHPVVLIKEAGGSGELLPIWIGPAEATAIYAALAGQTFERPMTHDLMMLIVDELGAEVSSIEITGIYEDTYFARIVLKRGQETFYIDARPSDSLALALRAGAAIRIDAELFNMHKRNLHLDEGADDDVKKRLEGLDPGSFGDLDI